MTCGIAARVQPPHHLLSYGRQLVTPTLTVCTDTHFRACTRVMLNILVSATRNGGILVLMSAEYYVLIFGAGQGTLVT